jgi:predicted GNAT family N-acyltransferase
MNWDLFASSDMYIEDGIPHVAMGRAACAAAACHPWRTE